MQIIKGDRLYVNLSASQVRRRLKGFGHGVRKIQSAGKNQAVIIHTATGQHLVELKAVFADALQSTSGHDLGVPICNLKNLGPTSASWLRDVGILTKSDLERVGPALAYRLVTQRQPRASLNLLWAMAAAVRNKDWLHVQSVLPGLVTTSDLEPGEDIVIRARQVLLEEAIAQVEENDKLGAAIMGVTLPTYRSWKTELPSGQPQGTESSR